jgi:hypothetical protein
VRTWLCQCVLSTSSPTTRDDVGTWWATVVGTSLGIDALLVPLTALVLWALYSVVRDVLALLRWVRRGRAGVNG